MSSFHVFHTVEDEEMFNNIREENLPVARIPLVIAQLCSLSKDGELILLDTFIGLYIHISWIWDDYSLCLVTPMDRGLMITVMTHIYKVN